MQWTLWPADFNSPGTRVMDHADQTKLGLDFRHGALSFLATRRIWPESIHPPLDRIPILRLAGTPLEW